MNSISLRISTSVKSDGKKHANSGKPFKVLQSVIDENIGGNFAGTFDLFFFLIFVFPASHRVESFFEFIKRLQNIGKSAGGCEKDSQV